ncbi:hypothetical protein K7432_009422 [Basidiobolus ranarum]|uniref:Uncharacterized protein n=1 Tax=Basidiobolus ranarum TaxID=34480 RepID=A0ABR2WQ95_9FUNG
MAFHSDTVFKVVNCVCGALMALGGINLLIHGGFQPIVIGLYAIVLGLALIALEFRIPGPISNQMPFLFNFFGKGLCNIGCIILNGRVINLIAGLIVILAGIAYAGLHFTSLKPTTETSQV